MAYGRRQTAIPGCYKNTYQSQKTPFQGPTKESNQLMLWHLTYHDPKSRIIRKKENQVKISTLFLYIQSEPSGVINKSFPKPALTKALTYVEARLCLAESTTTVPGTPLKLRERGK